MPRIVYLICISSGACLVMGRSPYLTYIAAIVWGVSLVIGGHFLNGKKLAVVFGLNLLLLYGLTGSSGLFFTLVFLGMPSFLMGYMLGRQKGYYELQKWGFVSAVIAVSLFIALAYYNVGEAQLYGMQMEVEKYMQESLVLSGDSSILKLYEEQGISREELNNSIAMVARGLVMHLPAFYYLQAMLTVLIILELSAYISRKKSLPILIKRPFSEEIMPWQFAWGIIVALSLWLWGRDELTAWYYVGSNLLVILATVTVYFGLSSLAYRWVNMNPRSKKWILIIFIILSLAFTLPAIIFIGLLGLFDSLLDYRKLRSKKEETR
ncbi:MAG: hypothetical protein CVU90_00140 [Firmicutes bacterium HGW-Firmicutes-15]|nr:MAG: hypothetical protein CVU90_00140 [Firmicutes bacterium HGW-Firmicutes-15]